MGELLSNKIFRTLAIIVHAVINFFLTLWMLKYDITGSWMGFFLFVLLCVFLLVLFVKHLISFIKYLQSN